MRRPKYNAARELIATVLKQAEIGSAGSDAGGGPSRLIFEAVAGCFHRATGEARSRDHFQEGRAEARPNGSRSLPGLQQAAVIDKLISNMPGDRQGTRPLANVDKITIVSTGNSDAAGMNKITGDVACGANPRVVRKRFQECSSQAAFKGRLVEQSAQV